VLDGFQATEEIRRREEAADRQSQSDHDGARLASVPILALTASATKVRRVFVPAPRVCSALRLTRWLTLRARSQEQAKRCLDAGMSDVLFKPLRRETLRAALSKWTTSSSAEASDPSSARPSQPPSSPASPLLSRPER
jgi:CheY-like chemotaxis protein